jgi:hypothetical protein
MSLKKIGPVWTLALAIVIGLTIGNSQLHATDPVQLGKNTDVSGVFVCDCTNTEQSCACKNAQ